MLSLNGWKWTTLGSVLVAIETGKSFRCEERPPESSEVGVVKVSAVSWGAYDEDESKTCMDASRIEPRYLVKSGDFLFSRANTIQLIGACVIAEAVSRRLMLSDKILRFRFTEQVYPKWVLYWLRSKQGRADIERLSSGNQESMRNIGQERIRAISLPLPPPDEQVRIVAEIEKQFTRLDAGVAALRRAQANLKRYRAAVLKAACEGRLVPTEAQLARAEGRPFESGQQLLARILTERRQNWQGRGKYKAPAELYSTSLPQLPEGWMWATADQLTSVITDGEHITPERSEFGILLLSARNVLDGRISVEDVDYVPQHEYDRIAKRLVVAPGDVLLSCSGSVGRSAVVPEGLLFTLVRSVAVLKPLAAAGKYLSIALRSPFLKQQILSKQTQTAQANIFQGKIKVLCVPVPPLAEQTRIVAEVERRLSVVEELESVVSANLRRATRLRQSILQKAFTGELMS
jgi:type I restriction enzyme, S subunit